MPIINIININLQLTVLTNYNVDDAGQRPHRQRGDRDRVLRWGPDGQHKQSEATLCLVPAFSCYTVYTSILYYAFSINS